MIEVVLGGEGIRFLKTQLIRQRDLLEDIVREIELRLAKEGTKLLYEFAPKSDVDGNERGSVHIQTRSKGYAVVYQGEDVAYIEFGTGYKGQTNPYPDSATLAKAGWRYDIHRHGVKGWFYYSKRDGSLQHSRGGMRPEKPVYEAYKMTRDRSKRIIEEVLHEKLGR